MKKSKLIIITALLTVITTMSTGCWNYKEINEVTMVAGMAVDRLTDGRFLVTFETVEPSGGKEAKNKPKIIQTEGATIFDSIRNATKFSGKKLYFSHTKIVIVSQDIAVNGISPVLDWLSRDAEPRLEMYLLVSKGKTANEIINQKEAPQSIISYDMYSILKKQSSVAKSNDVPIYKLNNTLATIGISPTLPIVEPVNRGDKKVLEVSGAAVFSKDKLIGFLNEDETKCLLFIRNRIKTPLLIENISVDSKTTTNPDVSLEVFKNNTKIIPENDNGKLIMNLNINTEAAIAEVYNGIDFVNDKNLEELIVQTEKHLETDITNLIKKVQRDFGVDIFGFSTILKANDPEIWKNVGTDWNQVYKNLEVIVNSKLEIRNEGKQGKPINIGG